MFGFHLAPNLGAEKHNLFTMFRTVIRSGLNIHRIAQRNLASRMSVKEVVNSTLSSTTEADVVTVTPGSPSLPAAKKQKTSPTPSDSTVLKLQALINQSKKVEKPIVWIDCEMTGLDIANDHIIEICCIITDGNLNIIDEDGYESTVYQPKEVLDSMNEWCVNQHNASGLVARILDNPGQTLSVVQDELMSYILKYIAHPRTALMAGNSIHMDKFFMMKEFPKVIEHLHYRLIDVSTIMEFGYRHNPALMKCFPKKQGTHTAKSDILESIAQLKWYRDHYFKDPSETKGFVAAQKEQELQNIEAKAKELMAKREEKKVSRKA